MKILDLFSLFLLFLGCFGSVYYLPPESFVLGKTFFSYFLILGGYGLFLFSITLSFSKWDIEKDSFRLKGILFGVGGGLYLLYGYLGSAPFVQIMGALILFFILVYYGQVLSDGLVILIGFAAVKSQLFSAPLARYTISQIPMDGIDLFYFTIGAIIIFQFFVLSKNLKTNLDFSVAGKDLLWIASGVLFVIGLLVPVGFSLQWLQFRPQTFGIQQWIPLLFYFFGIVAPLEEIFFRGIILDRLRFILFDSNPYWIPLALSSLAFGLAHLPTLSLFAFATIAGFFYGAGYLLTKRISTPIIIHGLINTLWVAFFSLPR
ncbi:MAG: CPBP family intramembrane metalloprotease [Nitrospirae bacterium]|nr:CPBP family intramembrane metalloprotease [Nitrospirota bacterium]